MKNKSSSIIDNSIVRCSQFSNHFYYNKHNTKTKQLIQLNAYTIRAWDNIIYQGYKFLDCSCVCFYKNYICKHILKVSDLFSFRIPEYTEAKEFATNSSRGTKPKKKINPQCHI